MKVIIAGGREFSDYKRLSKKLNKRYPDGFTLISGTARGANKLGERYAIDHDLDIEKYPAQ